MSDTKEKPKRHLFQLRRKESRAGRRDPYYTPERDLAHIGPNIVKGAMVSIEEKFWEPWLKEYLDRNGITYDTVLETKTPLLFAQALNKIIRAENPVVALEETGFTELPHPLQMLIYTRLGQVFLCAVWAAVKDVGKPDDAPPASIQELLEDAEEAFEQFLAEPEDE